MALLIDQPLWWWRGRRWAHLISDSDLDELHAAARSIGLAYVSFGFDHYDVPEELYPVAVEHAEVVDPRVIVRRLREAGLRTRRGKNDKRWKPVAERPPELRGAAVERWLDWASRELDAEGRELLVRPGEALVLVYGRQAPGDSPPVAISGARVVATEGRNRWSLELVVPTAGPSG